MRLHFRSAQAVNTTSGAAPQARLEVVIGAGSQAVTFGAQAPRTFVSGGTFALDPMATASSGLPVSYRTQTADVCTISGSTVTMQSAGTCTIRSEEHTSELQSLMRISYAVFCLKKQTQNKI